MRFGVLNFITDESIDPALEQPGLNRCLLAQLREHFAFPCGEEAVHIGPDLLHVHLVDPGIEMLADLRGVLFRVRSARDTLSDLIRRHQRNQLSKIPWPWQYLGSLPGQCLIGPQSVGYVERGVGVAIPADLCAGLDRLVTATGLAERLHELGFRHRKAVPVANPSGQLCPLG
ncbi:MAG: hypothetical protein QOF15_2156, partial [Mycobacterium sp.]|nr:hypothetical protein [Mycobacterium sp.]